ncbi:alpha/beta fold hydrolase [Streptomyces sp. NPDC057636]|uniref:alpha/beta fold hydrolase n=1 Tax=Streptomyces sp. NPDC057636 TaxID=3346189 RepID=UPI0036742DC4
MREIELTAGTVEYEDTGGHADAGSSGPTAVFLHGLMMDASLWDGPIAELSGEHRCVAPTLPLGAHRRAMPVRIPAGDDPPRRAGVNPLAVIGPRTRV